MAGKGGRDLDVLVVAEINPDVIVTNAAVFPRWGQVESIVESIRLSIGSSSAIFACGAACLGLRVAIIGVVGDDAFGRFMLEALAARNVDVSPVVVSSHLPTGASVILSRGNDRAILTAMGTIDALRTEDVPRDLISRARHVHVGSAYLRPALRPGLAELFADARAAGLTVSLDTNWDPLERWNGGIDKLLAASDLFLPNSAEVQAIGRRQDDVAAAEELQRRGRAAGGGRLTVAVKRGARGGLALRDRERVEVSGPRVPVVDTTGAGDSFDAGMVYGMLAEWPLMRSLELAVACGSLSVGAVGGTEGQPTLEQALALVASMPDETT